MPRAVAGFSTAVYPDGTVDVPTNVVFQVLNPGPEEGSTITLSGPNEVELSVVRRSPWWLTVTPTHSLAPGTTYTLMVRTPRGGSESRTYLIGNSPDETPPSAPDFVLTRHNAPPGPCRGGDFWLEPSMRGAVDSQANDLAYLVFAGADSTHLELRPDALIFESTRALGRLACAPTLSSAVLDRPDLALAVRSIDWAGNLSERSVARQAKTGGCAASAADAPLLAAVLLLLGIRRRTRTAFQKV